MSAERAQSRVGRTPSAENLRRRRVASARAAFAVGRKGIVLDRDCSARQRLALTDPGADGGNLFQSSALAVIMDRWSSRRSGVGDVLGWPTSSVERPAGRAVWASMIAARVAGAASADAGGSPCHSR
jgi:hypothetical protein